jgi:hypothetical protein
MSSKLFVGDEFFLAFSSAHTQACIGHHDLVCVNFGQLLRYPSTNHTTHRSGSSMKGPDDPYPSRNSWDKFVGKKSKDIR